MNIFSDKHMYVCTPPTSFQNSIMHAVLQSVSKSQQYTMD